MRKIIFVCTGNTCRSPMAEALFKEKLRNILGLNYKDSYNITSAGILVSDISSAPTDGALRTMKIKYDLDISNHKPTQLTKEQIEDADLILCMEFFHAEVIKYRFTPTNSEKVISLREYVGLIGDLADPYGGSDDTYICCAQLIDEALELLIQKEGIK